MSFHIVVIRVRHQEIVATIRVNIIIVQAVFLGVKVSFTPSTFVPKLIAGTRKG